MESLLIKGHEVPHDISDIIRTEINDILEKLPNAHCREKISYYLGYNLDYNNLEFSTRISKRLVWL